MPFTTRLWHLITTVLWNLPWLIVAGVAVAAFFRDKTAPRVPLIIQIVGALGTFLVALVQWLVLWRLFLTDAPYTFIFDT